nr:hypothetical protein [uncultured Rhodopila sp.]
MTSVLQDGLSRRSACLSVLAALAACKRENEPELDASGWPTGADTLGLRLTTPLPASVPLDTPLSLAYSARTGSYASLYLVGSGGGIVRLFENRGLPPGGSDLFPDRQDTAINLGPPAGAETFVLVGTAYLLGVLSGGDYIDQAPFPRLRLDRAGFQARLRRYLAGLPASEWQVQTMTVTTRP